MDVTWASDFFTEEVWTLGGLVTCYVLFFIHHGTRRVFIAGCTPHPNAAWVMQQARNFCMLQDDAQERFRYYRSLFAVQADAFVSIRSPH